MDWVIDFLQQDLGTAVVTALLTAVFTIVGFIYKDRADKKVARDLRKRQQLDTAKVYANPLLFSLVPLVRRLHYIFNQDADFLASNAPNNEFHRYMFRSTIYRLCVVLGWLRAANRELSGIEVDDQKTYSKISRAIQKFQGALAEGSNLAETRLNFLARLWNIPIEPLSSAESEELGGVIERLIWDALVEDNVAKASELSEEKQLALLNKILQHFKDACGLEDLDPELIDKKHNSSILAISRAEAWIYRDWQSAIGDMMLVSSRSDDRDYEVIGFSRFEDLYLLHFKEDEEENRWIRRVTRLFHNFKPNRDEALDARVQQLKDVCSAAIELVDVLEEVDFGVKKVKAETWRGLKKDDRVLNPRFY